jgi:hypothetical protein
MMARIFPHLNMRDYGENGDRCGDKCDKGSVVGRRIRGRLCWMMSRRIRMMSMLDFNVLLNYSDEI